MPSTVSATKRGTVSPRTRYFASKTPLASRCWRVAEKTTQNCIFN